MRLQGSRTQLKPVVLPAPGAVAACDWPAAAGSAALRRRILVGVIGAPHGVRGEVRLKSFTERPAAIASYGPLSTEDGRIVRLAAVRLLREDMLVARFEEIDSREKAAALVNARLHVDREALPAPDADEFYHADLIGLRAEAEDGRALGQVAAILNHGAGDILEIVGADGNREFVAFTAAFVPVVDVAAGRLVVADGARFGEPPGAPPPEEAP